MRWKSETPRHLLQADLGLTPGGRTSPGSWGGLRKSRLQPGRLHPGTEAGERQSGCIPGRGLGCRERVSHGPLGWSARLTLRSGRPGAGLPSSQVATKGDWDWQRRPYGATPVPELTGRPARSWDPGGPKDRRVSWVSSGAGRCLVAWGGVKARAASRSWAGTEWIPRPGQAAFPGTSLGPGWP